MDRRAFIRGLFAGVATAVVAPAMPITNAARDLKLIDFEAAAMSREMAFLEGISQTIMQTLWYGDPTCGPDQFSGFSSFLERAA